MELGVELLPSVIRETTLAVAVAGSTAGGYAGPKSDLDLIIIDESVERRKEEHGVVKGIRVSYFTCDRDFPFCLIGEDPSGFWTLREAARVRNCVTLFERDDFLTKLKERVKGLSPSPEYVDEVLSEAAEQVGRAERWISTEPELALLGLRNAFLLSLVPAFQSHLLPPGVYYSKPKWEWRTVLALGKPKILGLYRKLYGLDDLTDGGVRKALRSFRTVMRAVRESDPVRRSPTDTVAWARTEEFLSDVSSLREEGQIEATMAPLQFALLEMSGMVAEQTGVSCEWAPEGMLAMKRLLTPKLYDECKAAARLRPPPAAELSLYAGEVREVNQEIRELLTSARPT